ncbi:MAG: 50S ribosomal protein L21e [Candidatus Aenigmarchaeota archaeon]|nr:50S ribosomal protein L21e [Candidatus Aenigmarchaeota archaeon]
MSRSGRGFRTGTRRKFKKPHRAKFTVEKYLTEFHPKQRVMIDVEPSSTKNIPHYRYKGKTGVIVKKRGQAYVVSIKLGDKEKILMLRPEHLKPAR